MKCLAERLLGVRDHDAVPCRRPQGLERRQQAGRPRSGTERGRRRGELAGGRISTLPLGLRRRPHGQGALVRFAYCEQDSDRGQEREEGHTAHRCDPPASRRPAAAVEVPSGGLERRVVSIRPDLVGLDLGPPTRGQLQVGIVEQGRLAPLPPTGAVGQAPVDVSRIGPPPRPRPTAGATGGSSSRARRRPDRRCHRPGTTSLAPRISPRSPRPLPRWLSRRPPARAQRWAGGAPGDRRRAP